MNILRKSLGKDSKSISTPIPLPAVSKPAAAILPPQKVIRALAAYRPQAPQELPFQKGDFFYVLKDVEHSGAPWYEAHNPVTGARGLVPRSMFEEFSKNNATTNRTSSPGIPPQQQQQHHHQPQPAKSPAKTQVFYAIVLHDFIAERADELDAKRGDPISVVAQSNREWFVAQPIGRLGRPGLIPVTFVEIRNPTTGDAITDVEALMDRGELPKVEDWKRALFNYKQNSIALGVIDAGQLANRDSNSPFPDNQQRREPYSPQDEPAIAVQAPSPGYEKTTYGDSAANDTPDCLPEGILISARVVSFHYEMEEYWFRIDAIFQPYGPRSEPLPNAKKLVLFRDYNDFYDFQVELLDTFPREAGREPPYPRMLPYMPGPADRVDDAITATRRIELDDYLCKLCELNEAGARYVLEAKVLRMFLALKRGDVETDMEPRVREMEALFGTRDGTTESELRDTLGLLRIREDGKEDEEYEDEGYAPSPQRGSLQERAYDRESSQSLRQHAHAQNHQRVGSTSSISQQPRRTPSPFSSPRQSRSNSPLPTSRSHSPYQHQHSSSKYSLPPSSASRQQGRSPNEDSTRLSEYSYMQSRWPDNAPPPAPPVAPLSPAGRTRSQSSATNPSISAANPQTAFVKIKIFDRVTDDLIAIRVHPRVSHAELVDKVRARMGNEIKRLAYRDSLDGTFVAVGTDDQLRDWVESADKHVLFAD